MASICNDPNGRRRLQFTDSNGRRQTVRLGKVGKRAAETIQSHVEHLLNAQFAKQPVEAETARWVASLEDVLHTKLAKVGLIRPRASTTLKAYLDDFIAGRTDVKPLTIAKYNTTREQLIEHLGAEKPLRDIQPGDADEWRRKLKSTKMENTVRKHIAIAKTFFTAAVRKGLIPANPFADLRSTTMANPERFYFISREEATKVLAACPDVEWQLIFALSRFGGLRCPSEHLALTWDDVDWEQNRLRIRSPKTEHHFGKESRMIPIFPEMRPYLDQAFELAPPGTVYVINRYRSSNINLRTQLSRIIDRAGLDQWPKLFQNLRSTRQTELAETFPQHVVCEWIGNSKEVATKHYLQVTDDHFKKATQNPTQTVHDGTCQQVPSQSKSPVMSFLDHLGQACTSVHVAEAGLEPARGLPPTGF